MLDIKFEAQPLLINDWIIIRLPSKASDPLPSRGMVMVEGTINEVHFISPLEPDGKGSHWIKVDDKLFSKSNMNMEKVAFFSILPLKNWYEPDLPNDITSVLKSENLEAEWNSVTTKAKWEWIRWIQSTKNPETRQKRIEVTCSKLKSGKRRPCCFDQSQCTINEVCKNGVLMSD